MYFGDLLSYAYCGIIRSMKKRSHRQKPTGYTCGGEIMTEADKAVFSAEMRENAKYIAIRFPYDPPDDVRSGLLFNKWLYSQDRDCWYHSPSIWARGFASSVVRKINRVAGI